MAQKVDEIKQFVNLAWQLLSREIVRRLELAELAPIQVGLGGAMNRGWGWWVGDEWQIIAVRAGATIAWRYPVVRAENGLGLDFGWVAGQGIRMENGDNAYGGFRHPAAWWVAAAMGLLLSLWWPSDTRWVNDEPVAIHLAHEANLAGHLAPKGISHPGSTGIMYPPVTIWFYQVLMLISGRDLVWLAFLQGLVLKGVTLVFLWLIARELEWSPWPALLVLISPYLYLFDRQLWVITQLVPMGVVLFWLVVRFANTPSQWLVYAGFVLSVWMFHVHTGGSPLIAAWGLAMMAAGWPWLRAHWKRSVGAALAAVLAITPFVLAMVKTVDRREEILMPNAFAGLLQGTNGLVYFTAHALDRHFLPEMASPFYIWPAKLVKVLTLPGWLGVVFFLVGLVLAIRGIYKHGRKLDSWSPADVGALYCLLGLVFTGLMFAAIRQPGLPHFFCSMWILFFGLIWYGVRSFCQHVAGQIAVGVYVLCMGAIVASMALHIHKHAGSRGLGFGPTLGTQVELAAAIIPYRATDYVNHTQHYTYFPHALTFLMDIMDSGEPPKRERPPAVITISYGSDNPADAHLAVEVTPAALPLP